jgi:pyruvate/2-oxoglutarate dehydrogenase complex dihydrolipoamide acyltransferase (E2) component
MDGNGLELEPMPIHMPETGTGSKAKVVKWYKKEGDVVAFNDVICDIETDEFTFNMVNEDDVDALMGEIFVFEGDDVLEEGALLCTVFLPKEELYDDPPLS